MHVFFTLFLVLLPLIFLLVRKKRSLSKLPPGTLGLPFIGQSLTLLRVTRTNTGKKWLEGKVKKYGPISKMSLFGKPAVFIYIWTSCKQVCLHKR
ncbi:hypothetical protein LIER_18766 [Lithospermum erythrorhizon]|uniref:Cytochrome P450 n=1 Tax=Lithospermum erythrorhizon TaxID=34254 RepID=A0AAV3QHJ4_LITER